MSLAYSSLDEIYGNTTSKDSTNLTLLNVEQEAVCKLRQPKPKSKKTKPLGKYAEYEGSDINNRNKVITSNDVPMTDLHKATLDCKYKGREQQEVEGYNNGSNEFSNFVMEDFELKKYLLNADEMEALENNMMLKTQNDGIKLNKGFMPMDSNEVNNSNNSNKKKSKKKNNNNRNSNNSNSNEDDEIDETVMDKYMNLLLYVLSGILLILLMEQILQLGIKMKM